MGLPERPSAAEIAAGTGNNKRIWTPAEIKAMIDAHGGGGGAPTIQDEGTPLAGAPHSTLDFVGAGVTATDGGSGKALITIPGGGGAVSTHKHIPSRWYGPVAERTNSKNTTANIIDVIPIEIPETGDYDAMGFTAVTTRGSVKFAIYDSDNGGFPGTKLVDLGSIIVSAPTTILSITAFQVTAGFRWLVMIVNDRFSIHTINRSGSGDTWESLIGRLLLTQAFQSGFTISGGSFAAGLPSDMATLGTPVESEEIAHVNIRKA
jgi:hypothetical protein